MRIKADLSGLKHFMKTVEKYGQLLADFDRALAQICEAAQAFAEKKYANHGHSSIDVTYTVTENKGTIYANGEAVAFFEFGTGEYARGTYAGKLPDSDVPITGGWEYYYESDFKATVNGTKGWWLGHSFVKGNPAEAEMWETSQFIRQEATKIVQAFFKAESGGR